MQLSVSNEFIEIYLTFLGFVAALVSVHTHSSSPWVQYACTYVPL